MKKGIKKKSILLCTWIALFSLQGCAKIEYFELKETIQIKSEHVQEIYTNIVDTPMSEEISNFKGNDNKQQELEDEKMIGKEKQDYTGVVEALLNPVSWDVNLYRIFETDYLMSAPKTENMNDKKAVEQTAQKLNMLNKMYADIPFYTYYVNRATDVDWYAPNNITTFSYANYFEEQLGADTLIQCGQYQLKDIEHYMKTGYKTDFHINNRGSYEVYQDIYKMIASDMELSPMLVPKKEESYEELLFIGPLGEKYIEEFNEEQMDVFRTYEFDLGDYKSYVEGNEATVGLEAEYKQGKILRDVGFNHQFSYYGGQLGVVEFDFNQPDRKNLLLISDSQGRPTRKMIASHFNKTVFIDDSLYRTIDLAKIIEEKDIEVILFMGQKSIFEWYGG